MPTKIKASKAPSCWEDIERCACHSCLLLATIRRDCFATGKRYFIHDARMLHSGFHIVEIAKLFRAPASVMGGFPTVELAVAHVREQLQQGDVDALVCMTLQPFETWELLTFIGPAEGA